MLPLSGSQLKDITTNQKPPMHYHQNQASPSTLKQIPQQTNTKIQKDLLYDTAAIFLSLIQVFLTFLVFQITIFVSARRTDDIRRKDL